MDQERPKACRDCRFNYGGGPRCYHEKSRSYNSVGDTQWRSTREMREGHGYSDGGICGRDARLFELPVRTQPLIILRRWAIVAAVVVAIILFIHYR